MQADGHVRKALVTGGSRGIGAACCRALARDGWQVYINYNESKAKAQALAAETGGTAVWADVSLYRFRMATISFWAFLQ